MADDLIIPEFHCLQVFEQWWVVDVDGVRGLAQKIPSCPLC